MPALVGGFGNNKSFTFNYLKKDDFLIENKKVENLSCLNVEEVDYSKSNLGSYLAGLIEGDGTFAVHNKLSTSKKYYPMIIIVFKKSDLVLAKYLQHLTNCGNIYNKPERGYILWQIQDIKGIFTIVNLINGFMRTPKIEALKRTVDWLNYYIDINHNSNLPSTKAILKYIYNTEFKPLDESPITDNPWLAGFSDADANFSINIHKRTNKNSSRVQLFYRLEIRQTYHRLDKANSYEPAKYFSIMSELANYLGVSLYSRKRILNTKEFFSYIVVTHNKNSLLKINTYFEKFPLLSSKYLDYKDWLFILNKQQENNLTNSYLNEALRIRSDFNKTRTTYNWDHLKNNYLKY